MDMVYIIYHCSRIYMYELDAVMIWLNPAIEFAATLITAVVASDLVRFAIAVQTCAYIYVYLSSHCHA